MTTKKQATKIRNAYRQAWTEHLLKTATTSSDGEPMFGTQLLSEIVESSIYVSENGSGIVTILYDRGLPYCDYAQPTEIELLFDIDKRANEIAGSTKFAGFFTELQNSCRADVYAD